MHLPADRLGWEILGARIVFGLRGTDAAPVVCGVGVADHEIAQQLKSTYNNIG